jgi:L-idonate 5-dehydrogenase
MILGHEIAGEIISIGNGTTGFAIGDRVAVNPSQACTTCSYCQKGQQNHCLDMLFYGSAMRMPHVQGAFRQVLIARAAQCHVLAAGVSLEEGALAEPFAVTLHAIGRAGSLAGKRVLVTGCGPIGVLVIVSARLHGAQEIVATDVSEYTLAAARRAGADTTLKMPMADDKLSSYRTNKGYFDIMFECSGNELALRAGLECLRPRGILIQVGLGGEVALPQNMVVAKEIEIRGSFRFHEEFGLAIDLINRRRVDIKPLLTDVLPLSEAVKAFELASDRSRAMKVQIAF